MAGCIQCFIIPLVLFVFHRYIQPIILKFWNPWDNKQVKATEEKNYTKTEAAGDKIVTEAVGDKIVITEVEVETKKEL